VVVGAFRLIWDDSGTIGGCNPPAGEAKMFREGLLASRATPVMGRGK